MKTGSILTFGGWVLCVLGGLGGLLFVGPLVRGSGSAFSNLLAVLVLGAVPLVAGIFLLGAGRKSSRLETENEDRGFTEMAVGLAKQNGGAVGLDPICKSSGLPADEVQSKMRALTGRGLFDLDFDANGQMVFKLSAGAGQSQLAQFTGRS